MSSSRSRRHPSDVAEDAGYSSQSSSDDSDENPISGDPHYLTFIGVEKKNGKLYVMVSYPDKRKKLELLDNLRFYSIFWGGRPENASELDLELVRQGATKTTRFLTMEQGINIQGGGDCARLLRGSKAVAGLEPTEGGRGFLYNSDVGQVVYGQITGTVNSIVGKVEIVHIEGVSEGSPAAQRIRLRADTYYWLAGELAVECSSRVVSHRKIEEEDDSEDEHYYDLGDLSWVDSTSLHIKRGIPEGVMIPHFSWIYLDGSKIVHVGPNPFCPCKGFLHWPSERQGGSCLCCGLVPRRYRIVDTISLFKENTIRSEGVAFYTKPCLTPTVLSYMVMGKAVRRLRRRNAEITVSSLVDATGMPAKEVLRCLVNTSGHTAFLGVRACYNRWLSSNAVENTVWGNLKYVQECGVSFIGEKSLLTDKGCTALITGDAVKLHIRWLNFFAGALPDFKEHISLIHLDEKFNGNTLVGSE